MWPITADGFISIVEKPSDVGAGTLTVRARDKISLANFLTAAGIETKPKDIVLDMATDYPYRATVNREAAARWAYDQVMAIDYSNFKDEAKRRRADGYADALSSVWSALHQLETKSTRNAVNKLWSKATKGLGRGGPTGGGYGSLYTADVLDRDDWDAILGADSTEAGDKAEFERLCDLVAAGGIHALTDQEYAFYEHYEQYHPFSNPE